MKLHVRSDGTRDGTTFTLVDTGEDITERVRSFVWRTGGRPGDAPSVVLELEPETVEADLAGTWRV